jgi:hypothetical protein
MIGGVFGSETYDRCHDLEAIVCGRIGAEEIVFRQRSNKTVPPKDQRERFDNGRLAAVIGTDQN